MLEAKVNIAQDIFKVSKTNSKITIDGKLDEAIWQNTEVRPFNHFFDVVKPTDQQNSKFRMLWDEENLYLFYECEDQYITARETVRDAEPYHDDCAEIFLIPVPESLDMHFCLEINLYKTSNDIVYLNNFYNNEFAPLKGFNPEFEVEFTVDGTINDNSDIDKGWTMELAIPIKTFKGVDRFFPVKAGSQWKFLALRQDRNDPEGNRRTCSTIFPTEKDVHDTNFFGLLEFVE
ncbi:carbohydrate-binding family 9-like protein [Mariniflexile sp. AS56]|uniref:carbohydrate-binding family 9-like protein n=1 Tax=Mariniflexile sp. AS56 TaxID=3063957 RepID=UPI0026F1EA03|nr:carbohydrate-binding family 9-like protein [Mariniflexile sp. AS56]MDO7173157.1 carbohydrate-binding family 9-like protein [Mariniflexile sp. AS56]